MRTPKQTYLMGMYYGRLHAPHYRQYARVLVLSVALALAGVGTAAATTTSKSGNYSVTEVQLGGGSQQHQCSTNYCAKSTAGDTTVGQSKSANYSAQFGSNTTDKPLLQVMTGGSGNHDLGVVDSSAVATAVNSVSVRTYLMQGYAIALSGSSPSQGTHAILPMSTADISRPGTEQFGVNLVANTTPAIGVDPTIQPSGDSAVNYIVGGYGTANHFKYVPGDLLVENYQQDGEIDYTLSMILNVSNTTPAGHYKGDFSAVVVPLF